jgi:hypothetical protein
MSLVDIATRETLAEGHTIHMQGYLDGLLDGLEGTIGNRVPKLKE